MRVIGYLWALPVTVVGLVLAVATAVTGGHIQARGGVIETWGGAAERLLRGGRLLSGGAAVTFGHVILARNSDCMSRSRQHELAHVRQIERWGPLLLPAYWLISAWLWCCGYHPYLDHPLEPPPE